MLISLVQKFTVFCSFISINQHDITTYVEFTVEIVSTIYSVMVIGVLCFIFKDYMYHHSVG